MQSTMYGNPNDVLRSGATEEKGERAKLSNIMGAIAVADLVKTTLGPKGMDKILQGTDRHQTVRVTNDGATILKSVYLDNPAAKLLIDMSKAQDDEVGDGTTSVTVLAGELLRRAERLLFEQSIHPQTIIEGYRMASEAAATALRNASVDNSADPKQFKEDLMNIARTTLSSKVVSFKKEHFAKLCVDAVLRLKGSTNLEMVNIMKKLGGTLAESYLEPGFLLDKRVGMGQPTVLKNAKILVANTSMDTDKIKVFGAKVKVNSINALAEVEQAEKQKMSDKVGQIIKHDINCFINRQLIYNYPEELFAQAGIMAIEHADFEGVERLAKALGSDVLSTFDDVANVSYGHADLIDTVMVGEDTVIRFSGLSAGEACTIVLRGTSHHILDEAERSIHDALCVLSQTTCSLRTVLGGGCSEMLMSQAVDELARKTSGKRAIAMDAFSEALRMLPTIIADNAGLDSSELVTQLRAAHSSGASTMGLDVCTGETGDMKKLGITESFQVKNSVLKLATESAELILRVDDVLRAVPRQRGQ